MEDKKVERNQLLVYCANRRWLGVIKEQFSGIGVYDIYSKKVFTANIETLKTLHNNDSPYIAALIVVPSLTALSKMGIKPAQRKQIAIEVAPFHIWVIDMKRLRRVLYWKCDLSKRVIAEQGISIHVPCIDGEFFRTLFDLICDGRSDTSYQVYRLRRQCYRP